MFNYRLGILIFSSLVLIIVVIRMIEYIPKRYHKNIQLFQSMGSLVVILGAIITYNKQLYDEKEKEDKEYSESILESFEEIDTLLISNYEDLSVILDIFYSKIQIPSSDVNLNEKFKKSSYKIKDILFILYNKLTNTFERAYLINPNLFDNSRIGLRVKMYIDSIFYYEFWYSTKRIFNTNFVIFMEDKYKFLNTTDTKYLKPSKVVNRISNMSDSSFIFKSLKKNGLWY